jgi:hypothetical protein
MPPWSVTGSWSSRGAPPRPEVRRLLGWPLLLAGTVWLPDRVPVPLGISLCPLDRQSSPRPDRPLLPGPGFGVPNLYLYY